MRSRSFLMAASVIGLVGVFSIRGAYCEEPSGATQDEPLPVSRAVARDRAKLLHEVYASTLDVMHRRYFHGDRATVPARAMEDVFADMKRQSQIEARWIAVTLRSMSIDHDPETEFEKRAASEIKLGKGEVETVEDGYYRRAVAIPLSGGCVSCHGGLFRQSTKKHFAGLVISIPLHDEAQRDGANAVGVSPAP